MRPSFQMPEYFLEISSVHIPRYMIENNRHSLYRGCLTLNNYSAQTGENIYQPWDLLWCILNRWFLKSCVHLTHDKVVPRLLSQICSILLSSMLAWNHTILRYEVLFFWSSSGNLIMRELIYSLSKNELSIQRSVKHLHLSTIEQSLRH